MEEVSDFNLVEGKMDLVISDIVLLSKKEKAPDKYIAVRPALHSPPLIISIHRSSRPWLKEGD